jgi:DNA-binding NarL/FixJ family response regulator
MIVDDSAIARSVLHALLSDIGGILVTGEFESASEAIDGVNKNPPDALLLDIQLNHGNGMDVLNILSRHHPDVKVFVVTNHTDDIFRSRFLSAGAHGFFDKSRELDALRESLLALRREPDAASVPTSSVDCSR